MLPCPVDFLFSEMLGTSIISDLGFFLDFEILIYALPVITPHLKSQNLKCSRILTIWKIDGMLKKFQTLLGAQCVLLLTLPLDYAGGIWVPSASSIFLFLALGPQP